MKRFRVHIDGIIEAEDITDAIKRLGEHFTAEFKSMDTMDSDWNEQPDSVFLPESVIDIRREEPDHAE